MENERDFESDWAGWAEVEKPMTNVAIGLPEEMVEQLKQMAPRLGFQDYQGLIQYYVHNGMMQDREAMQKFGGKYEIARKMAEDAAKVDEITAFLGGGNQEMDEASRQYGEKTYWNK